MAEPTYTLQRDCTQCGHEITMAGVSFPGTSRTVTVRWTCSECGATRDEVIERRAIPGQPGYGEARPPVKLVPGTVAWKPEATFGTSPRPSDAVLNLTAVSGMSDGSPPPTPADEWSKPVKDEDGVWSSSDEAQHGERGEFAVVEVEGAEVRFLHDVHDGMTAPRDVVLRLLAAEASDRLGWVWEVGGTSVRGRKGSEVVDWSVCPVDGIRTESDLYLFSPDDVLASLMGRFLLADAIREAGQ